MVQEQRREVARVELIEVSKRFGAVHALTDVSLRVARGSVHALVGENGAGKSTLGKILAGVVAPDGGRMLLDGAPASFRSPREALEAGIAAIAQELSLVPQLTVAENVFLAREPRAAGFVRRRRLRQQFERLAETAGFDIPGFADAGRLRPAEQQKVEILRALASSADVIVMDEPSAALSRPDAEHLHEIIRRLARAGKTILLISHFLREVLDLADTVTVLRDGRLIRTSPARNESEASLIDAMLGRPLTAMFPPKRAPGADAPLVLSVRDLRAPGVAGASFDLRAGEILGLAGLVGAGRTELARALVGASRRESGWVELADGARLPANPRASLRAGVAMIPESRTADGLIFSRSVVENVSLSSLDRLARLGVVRRRREKEATRAILDRCDVRTRAYSAPVRSLSGGNQQKVLFARVLMGNPSVVIADEPTRGVDVGAKLAIYEFLVSLAEHGLGVLLISSELEEILGLAHRVLVMRRGEIVSELRGDEISDAAILTAAFAEPAAAGAA